MIGIVYKNITTAILEEVPIIEKAPALNNFYGLIYNTIFKFLVTVSIIV